MTRLAESGWWLSSDMVEGGPVLIIEKVVDRPDAAPAWKLVRYLVVERLPRDPVALKRLQEVAARRSADLITIDEVEL